MANAYGRPLAVIMRSEVLDGKEVIVYTVGKTVLQYDGRCILGLPRC